MAWVVWFSCSPRYFVLDEHGPSLHSSGCQFCPPSDLNTAASNMEFKKGPFLATFYRVHFVASKRIR